MESKLIQAFTGHGKDKVFAGDRKVNIPATVEEATELWGDDKFVKMAVESYVIDVQRELRSGGKSSAKTQLNDLISTAKQQKNDGDDGLFQRLVSLEIIKS
ncbi:hypothetical protein LCGC14_2143680 [marine sediment metagenome]|uniref:Uncharacterized protein n=1 Tax=marine sediment metagenome TaxID=412755 RepID=A0A0F9GAK3_9ZZZZ